MDAIIEEFGFDPDDDPFLLNRGARQLLALASIVVLAPPVVVLDEPTTGLDYRECEKVMAIIRRIHEQGATVIMVCHDMEVVADYAERCIVMSDGAAVSYTHLDVYKRQTMASTPGRRQSSVSTFQPTSAVM